MSRLVRRGQPVISLALLLVGWIGVRAALLDAALTEARAPEPDVIAAAQQVTQLPAPMSGAAQKPDLVDQAAAPGPAADAAAAWPATRPSAAPLIAAPVESAPPAEIEAPPVRIEPIAEPAQPNPFRGKPRLAAGHQLLWLAALAELPLPPEAVTDAAPAEPGPKPEQTAAKRWSADAWLLLRQGGTGAGVLGAAPSSYGASQAGAVIRYSLAPGSAFNPRAYLRVSGAVQRPRDEEAAVGLALRPVKGLPVAAMAELRATRLVGGTALRPAALLVSEFPPLPLPLGFSADSYGAAGYVGGRFATPFAEGQLRVERPMVRLGRTELSAGGGVWGGAQKGANRVDAGPSATLGFPLGAGNGRLSADWRFRLVGNSAPQSGPALTISAGF